MFGITSKKTAAILPLALAAIAIATPASANWFSTDPLTGTRRHVGSAPNPTPKDIRESRVTVSEIETPIVTKERTTLDVKILLDSDGLASAIMVSDANDLTVK